MEAGFCREMSDPSRLLLLLPLGESRGTAPGLRLVPLTRGATDTARALGKAINAEARVRQMWRQP